ncbi:SusD/RagB family nutrient-binding outer membrane lipoprotein [Chryseobacterium defluvii]|uniref:SusD/RagB-like outer membrane lipoprotein n=1 Tax=Chryseobacterium defluvii TaxID=160396 RepID=A0A495SA26_9FLAO|nr:SusD/RagB family nutrient-binding outer membrane lipoprotein [Chryseobacterium defluvii]RKS96361.1 SusD/RagB-like outer membrane lipoprotein [Chryseobacterium defluvii]
MKKINSKIIILSLVAALFSGSCTDDFENINSQYSGVTNEQLLADFVVLTNPLKQMQKNIQNPTNWIYQLQTNLNADMYSGLFSTATPYNGGKNNTTYFMMDGWNERIMMNQLEDVNQQYKNFFRESAEKYPGVDFSQSKAILMILRVIAAQKVSDAHGPVIYSKFESPSANGITDFDSQQDAYNYFVTDLNKAIQAFSGTPSIEDKTVIQKSDVVFSGNTANWAKLANSLKLRLAMRLSYADPVKSKQYAEEALSSPVGLIDDNSENALVSYGGASPLNDIIYSWGDCKIGAPLMAFMNGFHDPRISAYAKPATDPAASGQYIGVRLGVDLGGSKDRYGDFSQPIAAAATGDYFSASNGKNKIFTAAEAWFLKAEAAIRGYAGAGDAEVNYNKGIEMSFAEWGKSSGYAAYIADATSTEAPYIDPKNSANNILAGNPMLSTITIKWNAGDTFERKLERIMTQKWIAIYPDGAEAWAEQRRTGYPVIFKNILNDSQGTISTDVMIRRVPIPSKYRNNTLNYPQAVQYLGGPDTGATKLWWDKKI